MIDLNKEIFLGIDGGGTHTRIVAADRNGHILSYTEKGASSYVKDLNAAENVHQAIIDVVKEAGYSLSNVAGLAAGIAGYDNEEDLVWVKELTRVEGLECPCWHYNDSFVAHIGAFLFKPGIIAISGTGAIIFGITEEGKQLSDYSFQHYTWSTARHLSYSAVHKIIAQEADESDTQLIRQVLEFLSMDDVGTLRDFAMKGFIQDRRECDKVFGDMGPIITEAANNGSRIAMSVCNTAVSNLNTGIRLLGSCFSSATVPAAFVGSVIHSKYICRGLKRELGKCIGSKNYTFTEKVLSPEVGAVILAAKNSGLPVTEPFINRLRESSDKKRMGLGL